MVRVDSSEREAYKVVVLPEPVGPVARKMPCGRCTTSWMRARSVSDMPRLDRVRPSGLLVQQAQHHPFAVARRQGRYPHVHFPTADAQPDPAVLGHALLGDVEPRHDLDPGDQQRRDFALGPHDLAHHAVDPKAHSQTPLERFDVDVGGVLSDGFGQQRIDEPDDRGVVALRQQVLGFRDGVRKACQVQRVAHVLDHLAGAGRIPLIGGGQHPLELVRLDHAQLQFPPHMPPRFRKHHQGRTPAAHQFPVSPRPTSAAVTTAPNRRAKPNGSAAAFGAPEASGGPATSG